LVHPPHLLSVLFIGHTERMTKREEREVAVGVQDIGDGANPNGCSDFFFYVLFLPLFSVPPFVPPPPLTPSPSPPSAARHHQCSNKETVAEIISCMI
jgi:hypothetical protein